MMKADITPTEISPLTTNHAPKAATITNEILLIEFITGPIAFPIISAIIPVLVISSLAFSKRSIVSS